MAGAALRGRCGKERNLPGSAAERPGMCRACVTEPARRYSCARRWHAADDMDVAHEAHSARTSGCQVSFVPRVNIESNRKRRNAKEIRRPACPFSCTAPVLYDGNVVSQGINPIRYAS
jgi:hypothetical protein